jgi:hypothetical protein
MPRSAQASALLTFTVCAVCLALGVWLVLWLLLVRPKTNLIGVLTEESPVGIRSIAGLLSPGVDTRAGTWQSRELGSLKINEEIDNSGGLPLVLYLAAPIAEREGSEVGVVTNGSIEKLIADCQGRRVKSKLLLIIDPGRVGPDPVPGQPDDRSPGWLKALEAQKDRPADPEKRRKWDDKWKNFGILCAGSPDQFSWPVEGQGQTVFDNVLNKCLATPRTLQKTTKLVSYWVELLVYEYFSRAAQTPIYIGDPELDFFIRAQQPRAAPVLANQEDRKEQRGPKFWEERLKKKYHDLEKYAQREPYRHAPAAWRDYQEHLLRAERLYRARRMDAAEAEIVNAEKLEKRLVRHNTSFFGSLALERRFAPDPKSCEELEKALIRSIRQTQRTAIAVAGGTATPPVTASADKTADAPVVVAAPAADEIRDVEDDLFRRVVSPSPYVREKWNEYVEGQLVGWLAAYHKIPFLQRKPNLFTDERKALFFRAIELRLRG